MSVTKELLSTEDKFFTIMYFIELNHVNTFNAHARIDVLFHDLLSSLSLATVSAIWYLCI